MLNNVKGQLIDLLFNEDQRKEGSKQIGIYFIIYTLF